MGTQLSSVKALMLVAAASSLLAMVGVASAAEVASDNAGNYTASQFDSAFVPNQGSGFQNWYVNIVNNNSPPYAGLFLDTSGNSIATASNSWGVYANTPSSGNDPKVDLYRPLVGDNGTGTGALEVGQTMSWSMLSTGVAGTGADNLTSVGVALQNGVNTGGFNEFVFEYGNFNGEGDHALISDANGTTSTPITFSNLSAGLKLAFTLTTASSYSFTVDTAGGSLLYSHSGSIGASINQFDLFNYNTTGGNGYFNSLAVSNAAVPEPASLAMFGAGALGLLGLARRRQRV